MSENQIQISFKPFVTKLLFSLFLFMFAINLFTVTSAGTTKVQTTFGTVNPVAFKEGLHFPVNPLSSFDVMDTRNSKYEITGLTIPTQDRFNSTANITVLYRINSDKAPYIKQNYGTASEYLNKTLRQQLRSIVRDEGRKIHDSRGLAISDNIVSMQQNTKTRLIDGLLDTGIKIRDVLIQDIQFDKRILNQILATQRRIQKEEAQKSQERIAITNAKIARQEAVGKANAVKERADANAYKINKNSLAKKLAMIALATGEAEAIKLRASANLELTQSLTPEILEKQRLDNEAILYSKSKGLVPTTIIGKTNLRAIGVPIAATVK